MNKNRYNAHSKEFGLPIIAFVNDAKGIPRQKKLDSLKNPRKFKTSPYRKLLQNLAEVFGLSKSFVKEIGDQLLDYGEPDPAIRMCAERRSQEWMCDRENYPGYRVYDDLAEWDEEIRSFLESVVSGNDLKDNREFEKWVKWYEIVRSTGGVWVDPYGVVIVPSYLSKKKNLKYMQYPELAALVAICLIEFLKWKRNRQRLRSCPFCEDFFIADDIRRQRCQKKECNRAYERSKKKKQRDTDPVKYV